MKSKHIKSLKYGIRVMKWSGTYKEDPAYIYATSTTWIGNLILKFRGYTIQYSLMVGDIWTKKLNKPQIKS